MLSEKEKDVIRANARQLLERFGMTLERVTRTPVSVRSSGALRIEGKGQVCEEGFRESMFGNAPNATKDCIVAEKAVW